MKTAKNTKKIVMNQYLTPSPVFSRIESPLILSALLIGLLILTACGGAAAGGTALSSFGINSTNDGLIPGTNAEDWVASFASPLEENPRTYNSINQFLSAPFPRDAHSHLTNPLFDNQALNRPNRQYGSIFFLQEDLITGSGRSQREEAHYYAGLYDSTRVGLPLPAFEAGNPISANWKGSFRTSKHPTPATPDEEFELTVNFRDSTVETFFKDMYTEIDNYFHLNGSYDTGGIITGTVNYGTFSDIDARTPTDNRANNGVLTGIIGQHLAVGVFVSGTSTDGGNTITGGTGDDGFAGGFIASSTVTYNPNITTGDWLRSFATPLPLSADTTNPRNQFMFFPNSPNLGNQNLIFDERSVTSEGVSFIRTDSQISSDVETAGNSVMTIDKIRYYYAGVRYNSDLPPLPAYETGNPVSADWNGSFRTINGVKGITNADFALTVNFRDSTIEAFVKQGDTSNYYHIEGNYANNTAKNSDGVITGTVNYGTFSDIDARTPTDNRAANGILTGLIGQRGTQAVFVSGTSTDGGVTITGGTGNDGFAGWFWATPTTTYNPLVTRSDWQRSFATPLPAVDETNRRNQFLTTRGELPIRQGGRVSSIFDGVGRISSGTTPLYGTIAPNDGTRVYYANMDGEVGLPLPVFETGNTVSANWNGHFYAVQGADGETDTDFALTVNFRDSTIEAFVKENDDTSNYYHIEGNYANNTAKNSDGVITGTVNFGTFSDVNARTPTNNRATNGVLTGIIGQTDARGAFVSGTSSDGGVTITGGTGDNGFAGGFWARPTTTRLASLVHWRNSFATPLPATDKTNRRNQFVTGISIFDLTDPNSDSIGFVSFGAGTDNGVQYYYASLMPQDESGTPGPGVPLPEFTAGNTASARWNGRFHAYEGATGEVETDLTLEVNFENSRISALVQPTGGVGNYNINATYNANGVMTGTITQGASNQGLVTGLIGQGGAYGAFVSGTSTDGGVTITGGTGANGFVGGFVAVPPSE